MLCGLLNASVWAQAEPQTTTPAPAPSQSAIAQSPAPVENKITPQQAKDLFREVDEIVKFASDDTALPARHEVKRKLVTRDEVVSYLHKSMDEDKSAKRLQRSELVLKKFGLLPHDFDLKTFLVSLLREQVAGYYDAKTKTVNLLDWLDVDQQRPVLAHELTHALQDQSFGIEKWMKVGDIDLDEIKNPTSDDFAKDEIVDARQAVLEGQAMVVLIDYTLAPLGKSLISSPQMVEAMKQGMLVGTEDAPEFQNAPIFIKESLTFPYRYGIDFVAELLKSGGKNEAFAGAFTRAPRNTRQIMEPKTYLSGETIPPMPILDFDHALKAYDRFDIGAMGEFDVALLIDQYAGSEAAAKVYPAWRGGYYYAMRPKGDAKAPLSLVYVSRWESEAKASEFASIYASSLVKRYAHVQKVADPVAPGSLNGVDQNTVGTGKVESRQAWITDEGRVTIHFAGDKLLITESLDENSAKELDHELFSSDGQALPQSH